MDRGMYNAAAAGLIADRQMQVVANNLANVNTTGYRGQRLLMQEQAFSDTLASTIADTPARAASDQVQTPGVVDTVTVTDFASGHLENTGNPLNAALRDPNAFFVVQTAEGEAYTRAGNFTLNSDRQLVTPDGAMVLGSGGALSLPPGVAKINNSGAISVNGETVGKLRIVSFDDPKKLERAEGVRFRAAGGVAATDLENAEVVPESVEMPNINVVSSMVELVNASKAFEAYTKTARTIDELNERAIRNARVSS